MSMEMAKYKEFGILLGELRGKAGIKEQVALAKLVKSSQQTVSRWERGLSRPRQKQLPVIAKALSADLDELLIAAGYQVEQVVATFDQPFPVDALNPDSFERFCLYLLARLYPSARVHRAGKSGHTQDGLDVEIVFPDKTRYTFQCKRVERFGEKQVRTAIAAHTAKAKKKFFFISRVASPQARNVVCEFGDWDIWDKEDISRLVRQELPRDEQIRLVDTFFRGRRLALLGEVEPGPWQTVNEFFAPYANRHGAFNHVWSLVGRVKEIRTLQGQIENADTRVVFLTGAGGVGKSRVLKQALEDFQKANPNVLVRILSPTDEVTSKSLDDFEHRKTLLVVDDAHDRSDLQRLFQYAATPANDSTLLLAFRPYGRDYIAAQASNFALTGSRVSEVKLDRLELEDLKQLATQVLAEYGGQPEPAEDIAILTRDCTLATVVAAHVVAKEQAHPSLFQNEATFRKTVIGRFQAIVADGIGTRSDAKNTKKLLRVLALIQPFHAEDESVATLVEEVEGIRAHDTHRLMRLLSDAGVLFKRGSKVRLSPDLLADHIIEDVCIREDGGSTGYAERIWQAANNADYERILLNLAKLDWRLSNGDTSNSHLLDDLWSKLKPQHEYGDPYIKAITSVAYFQPDRALDFVEQQIQEGAFLRDLPEIAKRAAFNFEVVPRACECLWELGKADTRQLSAYPGHAIRILSGLCAVEPNKPLQYNEVVVDFALGLIGQPKSWSNAYTPFDILNGILRTEGHTTTSSGIAITFHPFLVSFEAVSELRNRVVDRTIQVLTDPNIKLAILAAKFLEEALRYPMGLFGASASIEDRKKWTKEFVSTLTKVERAIKSAAIDPLVLIQIARTVSWHAKYSKENTAPIAKKITAMLPASLEGRTLLALLDGWGELLEEADIHKRHEKWGVYLRSLACDLVRAYPDGNDLRKLVSECLCRIRKGRGKPSPSSSSILLDHLLAESYCLSQAIIEDAIRDPASITKEYAGMALAVLLARDRQSGRELAQQLLRTTDSDLYAAIGRGYAGIQFDERPVEFEDIAIIEELLPSRDEWVVHCSLGAVRQISKQDAGKAIELLQLVKLDLSSSLTDEVCSLFTREELPFRLLSEDQIQHFLEQLVSLPELEGYWIETFLANASESHSIATAEFFLARSARFLETQDWTYRACNHGPYSYVPLRFKSSTEYSSVRRLVIDWVYHYGVDDHAALRQAGEMFVTMFNPLDSEMASFFVSWLEKATDTDLSIIGAILAESLPVFILSEKELVIAALEKAAAFGPEALEDMTGGLYRAAISGGRSGIVGQPTDEDLRMKDVASQVLDELPRFSPARKLYSLLKKDAERNIQSSIRHAEELED